MVLKSLTCDQPRQLFTADVLKPCWLRAGERFPVSSTVPCAFDPAWSPMLGSEPDSVSVTRCPSAGRIFCAWWRTPCTRFPREPIALSICQRPTVTSNRAGWRAPPKYSIDRVANSDPHSPRA